MEPSGLVFYNVDTGELEGVWEAVDRLPQAAGQPDKVVWRLIARWPPLPPAAYGAALAPLLPLAKGVPVRVGGDCAAGLLQVLLGAMQ